jgi:ABC-type amino acid transport substrate-binding protein
VQLTPFGIFAIAAAAAGTMTIEELGRVQVYLVTYIAISLLVTFWIFPGLVAALSGIPFREVLDTFKDALMTAFATGNQFVVLPLIAENCKALLARQGIPEQETSSTIDVIVPVSFNFPSLGKMLVILFVLFAAWFTDTDIEASQYFTLASNGLLSLFGSINMAVPYMLDTLRVPIDMFQLFLITGVAVGRFGAMLAALHIIVLSVLGTLAMCGRLKIELRPILRYLVISVASTLVLLMSLRAYFTVFVPEPPARSEVLQRLDLPQELVDTQLRRNLSMDADTSLSSDQNRLQHIVNRGHLRVGYRPQNLPCTYREGDQVVGFDADMAQNLARDLGVNLQMIPFQFDTLGPELESGELDIAMSCIASLPDRHLKAAYSESYLDLNLAIIVPDHMRSSFVEDAHRFKDGAGLSMALVSSHYFEPLIKSVLPNIAIVELESAESFFNEASPPADALVLSAEEGAAYVFRHPNYTVVVPTQRRIKIPAAYALPPEETRWKDFVDHWISLKQKDGSISQKYEYWMQGGAAKETQPRWSIVRDVLDWVD